MKKKHFLFLIIFPLLFGGLVAQRLFFTPPHQKDPPFSGGAGFTKPKEPPITKKRGLEKTTVKVDVLRREDLDFILSYIGSLKAKDEAYVYAKVNGKLHSYLAGEGDKIEKGQTIALIDRDETGLKYELAKVDAALSGTVGRIFLDRGTSVTAQSTPLAFIVAMDEMTVKLNIPETDIPYFKKGIKALLRVDAYPNEEFTGEVSRVSEVVDVASRTLPIEITIPNPAHRLKSGMFARINVFAGKHLGALVVAQDAVVKEDSLYYVYLTDDSVARKIKVKPGIRQNNKIEILEGLEENQRVIVFGHQGLKDGAQVNVVE